MAEVNNIKSIIIVDAGDLSEITMHKLADLKYNVEVISAEEAKQRGYTFNQSIPIPLHALPPLTKIYTPPLSRKQRRAAERKEKKRKGQGNH